MEGGLAGFILSGNHEQNQLKKRIFHVKTITLPIGQMFNHGILKCKAKNAETSSNLSCPVFSSSYIIEWLTYSIAGN